MKLIKRLASAVTAAAVFMSGALSFSASAEESIDCDISYSTKYTYLEMTPSDDDNEIYFTTDGSVPTTDSRLYEKRLRTSGKVTIRAAEFDENGNKVNAIKVTLKRKCSKPEISIKKVSGGYEVTLSTATDDAEIYYTTDGSKPDEDSMTYDEPFVVEKGTVVRACAAKNDWKTSAFLKKAVKKATVADSEEKKDEKDEENETEYDENVLEVFELVNKQRRLYGLSELTLDPQLCEAAQIRAEELVETYSHFRPNGLSWSSVFDDVGFKYIFGGENIAYTEGGYGTPEAVMGLWMDSQGHKDNILNTKGSLIGIGCVKKGRTVYWVQLFGERR